MTVAVCLPEAVVWSFHRWTLLHQQGLALRESITASFCDLQCKQCNENSRRVSGWSNAAMHDQKPRATERNDNERSWLLDWFMPFEEWNKYLKMDGSIEKTIGCKKLLDERPWVDDSGWLGGALTTTGFVVVLVVPDLAIYVYRSHRTDCREKGGQLV